MEGTPPDELVLPDHLEETQWPWDVDSMAVALYVVRTTYGAAQQHLAALLAAWLDEDQENWPVLRLALIMPWQERPGEWHKDTPEWILMLGEKAEAVLPQRLV